MFEIISKIDTGPEIATPAEAKVYFRSEESQGVEDALILELIKAAREELEDLTGRSLTAHTIVVYAENWRGFLPYPNVSSITTPISFEGKAMPYVTIDEGIEITYSTIATSLKQLKMAVLELAFYWYKRGDEPRDIPPKIKRVIDSVSLRRGL